jgi:hypothetical protein
MECPPGGVDCQDSDTVTGNLAASPATTSACGQVAVQQQHLNQLTGTCGVTMGAPRSGFRVRYTLATKLVNELVEAADERQLAKTIARSTGR